jgi:hypothetical protein
MTDSAHKLLHPVGQPLQEGKLYLRLYHGRKDPYQDMDERSFNGPTFGPLTAVVLIYLANIRLHGINPADEFWLATFDDMVKWQGDYFGDFEVFVAGPNDTA